MKQQALFSSKDKRKSKIIKVSAAAILLGTLRDSHDDTEKGGSDQK